jgi:hypothetical protein
MGVISNVTNEEKQKIQDQCKAEIQAVLDKYNCRLDLSMITREDGNYPQIAIVCCEDE